MKRWEMVAKALRCGEEHATLACKAWDEDPFQEMDLSPARDLGRDIGVAIILSRASQITVDVQLFEWERLTGRAKEGQ